MPVGRIEYYTDPGTVDPRVKITRHDGVVGHDTHVPPMYEARLHNELSIQELNQSNTRQKYAFMVIKPHCWLHIHSKEMKWKCVHLIARHLQCSVSSNGP